MERCGTYGPIENVGPPGTMSRMVAPTTASVGPWFARRPALAAGSAVVLIAAITALRFTTGDESDATALLYALPIALVALAFGARAGVSASLGCLLLVISWVVISDASFGPLAWVSRIVPLLLLGILIGHASDAQREADAVATRLAIAEIRQRDAAEINDTIVQHLAAAKWMLERGSCDDAIAAVDEAMRSGQSLVSDLLAGLDDTRRSKAPSGGYRITRAGVEVLADGHDRSNGGTNGQGKGRDGAVRAPAVRSDAGDGA
jgi:signal transduction histidine kinase